MEGKPKKAKDTGTNLFFRRYCCQASGCVIADGDEELVQGSGEQGAVSSLPVGLGQVSGRVDVPDGAKIEAAATIPGTFRFWPWNTEAHREVQSRGEKIQFFCGGSVEAHGLCSVLILTRYGMRWD